MSSEQKFGPRSVALFRLALCSPVEANSKAEILAKPKDKRSGAVVMGRILITKVVRPLSDFYHQEIRHAQKGSYILTLFSANMVFAELGFFIPFVREHQDSTPGRARS